MAAIADINVGKIDHPQPQQGYWWSLPNEPLPFRNGDGLLKTLEPLAENQDSWGLIKKVLGGEIHTVDRHYFAFRYPARAGGFEWLFLVMPRKSKRKGEGVLVRSDGELRAEFGSLQLHCYRAHSLRPADLNRRNRTVIDSSVKAKKGGIDWLRCSRIARCRVISSGGG